MGRASPSSTTTVGTKGIVAKWLKKSNLTNDPLGESLTEPPLVTAGQIFGEIPTWKENRGK